MIVGERWSVESLDTGRDDRERLCRIRGDRMEEDRKLRAARPVCDSITAN
jgi:hypothetical protein